MRHLKYFQLFEGDNSGISRRSRDILGIWNYFKIRGPILVNLSREYFDTLDWEKEDVIDEPDDHVKIWSVNADDGDGFSWGSEQAVVDDHYDESVEFQYVEVFGDEFFLNQIKDAFERKGFFFEVDKSNILRTDATVEDLAEIFPDNLQYTGTGKKGEFMMGGQTINPLYSIRFDIMDTPVSYIYIKNEDGTKIWSSI